MKLYKAAVSFDESQSRPIDSLNNSPQGSVKFDLTPMVINEQETYRSRMKPKRSDTARRHVLSRQRPIEDEIGIHKHSGRRNSTHSDSPPAVHHHRRSRYPRQGSTDSRMGIEGSPSPEQKFRSQISVCSEPPPMLSCQSSIEPVVPEENTPEAEKSEIEPLKSSYRDDSCIKIPKKLHRSSSTKSYKEKKKLEARKNNEIARLFAMQTLKNRLENEHDIEVISERRLKNFVSESLEPPPDTCIEISFDNNSDLPEPKQDEKIETVLDAKQDDTVITIMNEEETVIPITEDTDQKCTDVIK